MTSVLTDEEIESMLDKSLTGSGRPALDFAAYLEAAVIRKLAGVSVEPVGFASAGGLHHIADCYTYVYPKEREGASVALYTAETIAAARVQALEEAAKVCDVTPVQPFRPSIEAAWAIRTLIGGPNHG